MGKHLDCNVFHDFQYRGNKVMLVSKSS